MNRTVQTWLVNVAVYLTVTGLARWLGASILVAVTAGGLVAIAHLCWALPAPLGSHEQEANP